MPQKIIVIVGPTASGKSSLGIQLAKKFRGEIISADSRQVYKGMDIGTGKVTKQEQKLVPHHLLDVASPKRQFTVSHFVRSSKIAIATIFKKNKLPFIVGGTAFYVYALIDDLNLPQVKPNPKLRKQLEKKTTSELIKILKQLDPARAKTIDLNNRVRLIRAIEINKVTGHPVPKTFSSHSSPFIPLFLGIKKSPPQVKSAIGKRVDLWFKQGLIAEVKKLKKSGLSYKKIESFGLEYRLVAQFLQNKIFKRSLPQLIKTSNYQFAKRQMTWFKKDKRIHWISNSQQAEQLIKQFIKRA